MGVSGRLYNGLKLGFEILDGDLMAEYNEDIAGAKWGLSIEVLCFGFLFIFW